MYSRIVLAFSAVKPAASAYTHPATDRSRTVAARQLQRAETQKGRGSGRAMEAPFYLATSCFHKRNWILRVIFTRMSAEPQQQRKQPASGKKPSEYGRFG
ncbi:exported hypothetical protein [Xanthomonas citri pv. fuscans]|nr:hypothetical protein DGN11_22450 [Xanthomonas citri pv. fuscans]QWN13979.1 hypothetical protein DGN07_23040 [Xanthomonas citri pv. fuscans]SON77996.1 exported hypothetical protein [Xanthomonas citri pv. fuscans]SOO13697.1 exported hypothetical protein [Xanthomonas citri pv. fuscans]SOO43057.1 exported hypothetical protein [Xanthomonas citri pv. fuscans]